jgi:hypothetical protein
MDVWGYSSVPPLCLHSVVINEAQAELDILLYSMHSIIPVVKSNTL